MIAFRILGQLEISGGDLHAAKHRVLLACLLAKPNRVVPVSRLIECLWDNDPPDTARAVVQTYVSRVRKLLGSPELIETSTEGYRIKVEEPQLDLLRFRALVKRGKDELDPEVESALLKSALRLWSGSAFAGLPSPSLQAHEIHGLNQERWAAADRRIELDLALGRHRELVIELRSRVRQEPVNQRLRGHLMLALYNCGRQAEALACYQELRRSTGVEAGPELNAIHRSILRGEAGPPCRTSLSGWRPISQLPPDTSGFIGRDSELTTLASLLDGERTQTSTAPVIVLAGPPGVGKTALAVHAAHSLKSVFSDGQLYVNLRGYSPEPPATPAQMLPQFLRAMGIPADQVPLDEQEQIARYRSLLAGRRVLVVLDNASLADQVHPLIPATPGSSVLVTSRNNLVALPARQLHVEVLGERPALGLLRSIIGESAVDKELEAANTLVKLCGALPLALRIAAANITYDGCTIESYVDRMRSGERLTALSIDGDREAGVRAAFDLSYNALPPEAQTLFRVLSIVPGPDFTAHEASVLTEEPLDDTARTLDLLATANLLQRRAAERFQFHDLIRSHATETRIALGDPAEDESARNRLFEYHLHATRAAVLSVDPQTTLTSNHTGTTRFPDPITATQWLHDNRTCLVAAAKLRENPLAPHLADALASYFEVHRLVEQWAIVVDSVTEHATSGPDTRLAAALQRNSANLDSARGHYWEAAAAFGRERAIHQANGDVILEINAIRNVALARRCLGDLDAAMAILNEGIELAESLTIAHTSHIIHLYLELNHLFQLRGDLRAANKLADRCISMVGDQPPSTIKVTCLGNAGGILLQAGKFTDGISALKECLAMEQKLGWDRYTISWLTLITFGYCELGRLDLAQHYAERALDWAKDRPAHHDKCFAYVGAGYAAMRSGRWEAAEEHYRAGLELLHGMDFPAGNFELRTGRGENARRGGDLDLALHEAEWVIQQAREGGHHLYERSGLILKAWTMHDRGEFTEAKHIAADIVPALRKTGYRPELARALYVLGRALAHTDGGAAALPLFFEAQHLFAEMGMPETAEVQALIAEHEHCG